MPRFARVGIAIALSIAFSCDVGGDVIEVPPLPPPDPVDGAFRFFCQDEDSVACDRGLHWSCERVGEFIEATSVDCNLQDKVCDRDRICVTCRADTLRCAVCDEDDEGCETNVVQRCAADGDSWEDQEVCEISEGDVCFQGGCQNMCELAEIERSYVGCEFYAVDLDNAAIDNLNNASNQQFAVAVTNPQSIAITVRVEINEAPFGDKPSPQQIESVIVPPGAIELFELPRREVDGSTPLGLNDGTHTAVTSNAFRLESTHPIIAYQFNPLENTNVFSNDASLLLPTSAIGDKYTVVGWPQTIGDSDNPDQDFDSTTSDEDLRAFLTIVGTVADTALKVTFGKGIGKVVAGGPVPQSGAGDVVELNIGPFDVVNLETAGFNADFTGTVVETSHPVTVFVGSEASDVPIFGTYQTRQCCADHLEEQLFPDAALGVSFIIARMPARTTALQAASFDDDPLNVAVVNEPEWVRIVAVADGSTSLTTTLPFPDDRFSLGKGQDAIVRADQDFLLDADKPVAVLQAMPSQGVTGIPRQFPGGDPAIVAVPPRQQYRRDYIFLTPDKYAFDFVTITAEAGTAILLDGEPLPEHCTVSPADGITRTPLDPEPDLVIHRCQLSFPKVTSGTNSTTLAGDQDDGVHTILADNEVGIVVYGFDRFVSYAYAGGLDLEPLN